VKFRSAKSKISLLTVAVVATAGLVSTHGAGATPPSDPFARGRAAIDRLGDQLPEAAFAYGMSVAELQNLFLTDSTFGVDRNGLLAYIDESVPGETAPAGEPSSTVFAPPVDGPEFQLASLPGADKTIYLDFDGHVTSGTSWNNSYGDPIITNPFDTNGNFDQWSASELTTIRSAWAAVAEDFAPWNINVTTIEPPLADLAKSGAGDTKWGARVVITRDTFANCGCGGFAYLGSFTSSIDTPTFVFNTSSVGVSEAASHEVGHMLGLSHDGTSSTGYYYGHTSADTPGWAPIMGAGYNQPVTQWSKGEYFAANQAQDDTTIIGNTTNGFGLRSDDHGDTAANGTPFNGNTPTNTGIIGTKADVDVFTFTTVGGAVTFTTVPAATRPNLDITMTLFNSVGNVVATHNDPKLLTATLSTTLAAGSYSVEISAVGAGSPLISPPTGFTDYANLGAYTVSGTIENSGPPDTEAPATPTGLAVVGGDTNAVVSWSANTESDLAHYLVKRSTVSSGPYVDLATVTAGTLSYTDNAVSGGTYYYVIAARDAFGNTSAVSSEVSVSLPYITRAISGQQVAGTSTGAVSDTHAIGGGEQTITEALSGGSLRNRHDLAEYRWTIPASVGNQTLAVVASVGDGGDADSGFNLEWSTDGSTWRRLATVVGGSPLNTTFDLGAPSSNVLVRVIDTNRSGGNTSLDRITVDYLQITGDGSDSPPPPPTATKTFASLTTSTASGPKGTLYGVATVTVTNDLGAPVVGATVTVQFSGSFSETRTGVTNSSGVVSIRTSTALKSPVFTACISGVINIGILSYQSGAGSC